MGQGSVCFTMEPAGEHIRIQHLEKSFGSTRVLRDVNMSVGRGEVAVVIGGSGAGKTTLLKILIGLDRPTSGSVLVEGVDLCKLKGRELAEMRKKFGMVFQYSALLDSMNVLDNVAFPLREHTKLPEKEIRKRVKDKLSQLKLENVEEKFPSQLSGGMRKRVGLARALMLEPETILYDEPTSGLDPKTSRLVDDLILETRDTFGVTSIVISHDMAGALLMGDQIFMLARGEVVASGTPRALVDSQNDLVQEFLDSSGIAPERVLREKTTNGRA
ncbi:MAG TPA: ABC transporter ATP-binding protein [Polyangiaceae bacterium]|nr:ABC transporter ATP-binding protein [Polyangiaceae bacterium]